MHFVFQEAVDRHFRDHTYSLLHKLARYGVLLREQRRFYLTVTADAVEEIVLIVQNEVNLSEFAQVAPVWECLLSYLLLELLCDHTFRILAQWWIDEFYLRTDDVMEADQKYVVDVPNVLGLKILKKLLRVSHITGIEKRRPPVDIRATGTTHILFVLGKTSLLNLFKLVE